MQHFSGLPGVGSSPLSFFRRIWDVVSKRGGGGGGGGGGVVLFVSIEIYIIDQ